MSNLVRRVTIIIWLMNQERVDADMSVLMMKGLQYYL